MQIHGVLMLRNEVDVVGLNVLYHLAIGFDRLFIVDNGSEDGTREVLRTLGKDRRIRWTRDEGGFSQGAVFTELARQAHDEGADWVVPLDADEFWHAPRGSLRDVLEKTATSSLRVRTKDFVQRREQTDSSPRGLLHMTRRVPYPVARDGEYEDLLESDKISYIELDRVPKYVSRSSESLAMVKGAHSVGGIEGDAVSTDEIEILHAPLRSFSGLEAKALSVSRRGPEGSTSSGPGWHARRWSKLRREGRLAEEWVANSYADDCLDVHGVRRPLVFDPTLRDAVSPFLSWNRRLKIASHPFLRNILRRF